MKQRTVHPWIRALLGGGIWFGLLFCGDTIDSFFMLQKSTKRIRTDVGTIDMLRDSVLDYFQMMGVGYALLAILAAVSLHLALRLWFPQNPQGWAWWKVGVVCASVVTLIGNLHQAVLFPALHGWLPFPIWYADHVDPWMTTAAALVVCALALAGAAFRWRAAGKGVAAFVGCLMVLLVWLGGLSWLLSPPSADAVVKNSGPNVVFIGVDALRPDRLASGGHTRDTAPHMDALLAESVVFEQAFTQLPRTYPSWMSLLTGDWPITHGIRDNLPEPSEMVPKTALLSQVLRDDGYSTAFVTDDSRFSYMVPETGFSQIIQPQIGVQNFAVSVHEPRYRAFHGLLFNKIGFNLVPTTAHNQAFGKTYRPIHFAEQAVDSLAKASEDDRFFYAVHSCVLHAPGDRTYPWHRMYGQQGYGGKNRFRYSRSGTSVLMEDDQSGELVNVIAEHDEAIYDSGIDMADHLVGRIMGELRRSGNIDNTIVVLFSDHGEELWAPNLPYKYGGPNHGFHMYGEGQLRVLLGIRFPDGLGAGTKVSSAVRLIDLAPTMKDVLNLEWPNEMDGKSLLPLIRGEQESEPREVYAETGLSEKRYWVKGHVTYPFTQVSHRYAVDKETGFVHVRPEFRPYLIKAKDRMVQIENWKLVWLAMEKGVRFGLYDREKDPYNRRDLSSEYPDVVARLGARMAEYLRRDGEEHRVFERWERLAQQSSESGNSDEAQAAEPQ